MARRTLADAPKPAMQDGPMRAKEFCEYVEYYKMAKNLKGFGQLIGGIGPRSVGRYMRGDQAIPTEIANKTRDLLYKRQDITEPQPEPTPAPTKRSSIPDIGAAIGAAASAAGAARLNKPSKDGRKLRYVIEIYEMED